VSSYFKNPDALCELQEAQEELETKVEQRTIALRHLSFRLIRVQDEQSRRMPVNCMTASDNIYPPLDESWRKFLNITLARTQNQLRPAAADAKEAIACESRLCSA